MQEDKDNLNWTHQPHDKSEKTIIDMSREDVRKFAQNAKKLLEEKSKD